MEVTKILVKILSFTMFSMSILSFPNPKYVHALTSVPVLRLSGADRYETAVAISREGWKTSEYVVLAAGEEDEEFADALSGSPISFALNAPLLLTNKNQLSTNIKDEIIRLNAVKAVLLGGTGVISDNIEKQLISMGMSVERLWGPDRYGTAVKIAEKIKTTRPFSKVFLATGEEFQYAMMIAPYAARNGIPILFSEKDTLNPDTLDAIKRLGIYEVDIIGNTNTLYQSIEDNLKALGIKVSRISGATVSDININIINTYKMDADYIAVARDDLFADSLSGVSYAAIRNMHIILTGQDSANPIITDFLNKSILKCAYIFGGSGGVSDYIISLIRKGVSILPISGNSQGNINSGGLASVKDGWVYYHNAHEGGRMYKIKTDGTLKSKICEDIPLNINIVGDWIYYTSLSDNSKIYKIRTDGTCRIRLNDDQSLNTTVIDNWIYYINLSDSRHLYKMATDGTYKEELAEYSSKYVNILPDWVYYINSDDGNTVYRVKPDDSSQIQELTNICASGINVIGSSIYFINARDKNSLYRISADCTNLTKLSNDLVYEIQINYDWIYYSNGSDGNKLYKIKTDGTERALVYDGNTYLLNIVGDELYFMSDEDGLLLYKIKTDGTCLTKVD